MNYDDLTGLPDNHLAEFERSFDPRTFAQEHLNLRPVTDILIWKFDAATRNTVERAMQLELPYVAAGGFESYRDKLIMYREARARMIMFDQGGAAWRPIVYLPEVDCGVENGRLKFEYTPIAGIRGWAAFQEFRSMRNT